MNALKSGLGAVLLQELVSYASRAMIVTEQCYVQIENEKKDACNSVWSKTFLNLFMAKRLIFKQSQTIGNYYEKLNRVPARIQR